MKICNTYTRPQLLRDGINEVRASVFETLPPKLDENTIIVLGGKDESIIPKSFKGIVDNGSVILPDHRAMKSVYSQTEMPSVEMFEMHSQGPQEVTKVVYKPTSFKSLHTIFQIGSTTKKHVLIGEGEFGRITRIRSDILNNAFTYGYADAPQNDGEYSVNDLERLEGCTVIGVVGKSITNRVLQPAFEASFVSHKMKATCLKFDTSSIECISDVMREYDIQGMNVLPQYVTEIIDQLDSYNDLVKFTGAANTIINNNGKIIGYNTILAGVEYAVRGNYPSKVLLIGNDAVAASIAHCMHKHGSKVYVIGPHCEDVSELCKRIDVKEAKKGKVRGYDLIINCSALGLDKGEAYPVDIEKISDQMVLDMNCSRETELVKLAKQKGVQIISGKEVQLGIIVESYRIWFGKDPDVGAIRQAISF